MGETLSAKDIEKAEFSVTLRGYDREEVEAFLRSVASDQRRLRDALDATHKSVDKPYQSLGSDMGELLQHAKDSADQLRRRAEEEAKAIRQEARKDADSIKDKAEHGAQEARRAADYDASERIKDAERKVRQLMETEAEARKRLRDLRKELEGVIERLEEADGALVAHPSAGEEAGKGAAIQETAPNGSPVIEPSGPPARDPAAEVAEPGAEQGTEREPEKSPAA